MTFPADPRDYTRSDKIRETWHLKLSGQKRCRKCFEIKHLLDFDLTNSLHRRFRRPYCRECTRRINREYMRRRAQTS